MAGILANSASAQMVAGDTSPTNSRSGFIVGEQITLGITPAGECVWGQSIPRASAPARSKLNDDTAAAPKFTPDVGGTYVVTVVVDGTTTYTLVLAVVNTAVIDLGEGIRLSPVADAQVPAPTLGRVLYFSSTQDALVVKLPDDSTQVVDVA
jgi:hypothetical protein